MDDHCHQRSADTAPAMPSCWFSLGAMSWVFPRMNLIRKKTWILGQRHQER